VHLLRFGAWLKVKSVVCGFSFSMQKDMQALDVGIGSVASSFA